MDKERLNFDLDFVKKKFFGIFESFFSKNILTNIHKHANFSNYVI
tara:strand:+ start:628 stop:762 length:135 start_codon:yes stop_codon:yes gene_type:complete